MKIATALLLMSLFAQVSYGASPQFGDYPVLQGSACKLVVPQFPTGELGQFRTQLRNAASRRCPEFAGHYIVAIWGCGSPCQEGALIDVKNGQVHKLPFLMRSGAAFHPDSALFVVNPDPGTLFETEWWVWEKNHFQRKNIR